MLRTTLHCDAALSGVWCDAVCCVVLCGVVCCAVWCVVRFAVKWCLAGSGAVWRNNGRQVQSLHSTAMHSFLEPRHGPHQSALDATIAAAAYSAADRAGRPLGTAATLLSDRPFFFSPDDVSLSLAGRSTRTSLGVDFSVVAFVNLLLLLLTLSGGASTDRAGCGVRSCTAGESCGDSVIS
jgi:hypothetical protein